MSRLAEVISLRPYQIDAIEALRAHIRNGKRRILLVMPTGGGKTQVASAMINSATARGKRCVFICNRRELIDQTLDKLAMWNVEAGVIMSTDRRRDDCLLTQVASVQTLIRRLDRLPPADVVIVDECHRAMSKSFKEVLERYSGAVVLGLTATPWRTDRLGLSDFFEAHVVAATPADLIAGGALVPYEVFAWDAPDLHEVKIVAGDYSQKDLAIACNTSVLVGSVVREYVKHANGRPAIVFPTGIDHSNAIVGEFNGSGVRAKHVDCYMPSEARREAIEKFKRGEITVISSVGILCLDRETEVLTSNGWVGCEKMTADHEVANWDNGSVFFAKPSEVIRRLRLPCEDMAQVTGSRMNLRVTGGHRMLYRWSSQRNVNFKKKAARDLIGKSIAIPVSGRAEPFDVEPQQPETPSSAKRSRAISANAYCLRKNNGYGNAESFHEAERRFNTRASLRYRKPSELSVDECMFIGFWIGDGSTAMLQSGGREYIIAQSVRYHKIISWFDDVLARLPFNSVRRIQRKRPPGVPNDTVRWSFPRGTGGGVQERNGLFAIEPYLCKNGTPLLWGLREDQFDALIKGFWFADGDHGDGFSLPRGHSWKISNTNKDLVDLLQAIASVRGYRASITIGANHKVNPKHKVLYQLRLNKAEQIILSRSRIEHDPSEWRHEEVWCVKTKTQNIVTRRCGRVSVMGNCEGFDAPNAEVCILARPTKSLTLHLQQIGRVLRPSPATGKLMARIHCHSGNILRHGLPDEERDYSPAATPKSVKKKLTCPNDACRFVIVSPCLKVVDDITYRSCPKCGELIGLVEKTEELKPRKSKSQVDGVMLNREQIERIRGKRAASGISRELTDEQLSRVAKATGQDKAAEYRRLLAVAERKGFKPGWAAHAYRDCFGVWPRFDDEFLNSVAPASEPFIPLPPRKDAA